jgi:hypothetical protein
MDTQTSEQALCYEAGLRRALRVLPRSVLPHMLRDQDRQIDSRLRAYSP